MRLGKGVRNGLSSTPVYGKRKPGLCPCCGLFFNHLYRDNTDGIEKCWPCFKAKKGILL